MHQVSSPSFSRALVAHFCTTAPNPSRSPSPLRSTSTFPVSSMPIDGRSSRYLSSWARVFRALARPRHMRWIAVAASSCRRSCSRAKRRARTVARTPDEEEADVVERSTAPCLPASGFHMMEEGGRVKNEGEGAIRAVCRKCESWECRGRRQRCDRVRLRARRLLVLPYVSN